MQEACILLRRLPMVAIAAILIQAYALRGPIHVHGLPLESEKGN